jgi:hypothetical protein
MKIIIRCVAKACTNHGRQFARAARFCTVEPYKESSVWILLHVDLLEPRNLGWFLDFGKRVDP